MSTVRVIAGVLFALASLWTLVAWPHPEQVPLPHSQSDHHRLRAHRPVRAGHRAGPGHCAPALRRRAAAGHRGSCRGRQAGVPRPAGPPGLRARRSARADRPLRPVPRRHPSRPQGPAGRTRRRRRGHPVAGAHLSLRLAGRDPVPRRSLQQLQRRCARRDGGSFARPPGHADLHRPGGRRGVGHRQALPLPAADLYQPPQADRHPEPRHLEEPVRPSRQPGRRLPCRYPAGWPRRAGPGL